MPLTDSLGLDFPALLGHVRAAVDQRLAVLWDAQLASLQRYGADVLAMASAARELTLRGGKRFRAALLAAAYAGVAPNEPLEPAYQAGMALELLQTYLLIQDDWIDGDVVRRGGPAAHAMLTARWNRADMGASVSILASDLTWSLALHVLSSIELPAPRVLAAVRTLMRIHEDIVVGQTLDVVGSTDIELVDDLKTGSYTVRGPLLLGATLAGAPDLTLDALRYFAAPLGVAFQMRDDLLGIFGVETETGKPVGNDLRTGKRTAVIAEVQGRLSQAQQDVLDRAFGRADATAAEVADAAGVLDACGARAAVARKLARLCAEAEARAVALPLTPTARTMLAGAAAALAPGAMTAALVEPGARQARA